MGDRGRDGESCGVVVRSVSGVTGVSGVSGVRGVWGGSGVVTRVLLVPGTRWIVGGSEREGEISELVSAGGR